MPLRLFNDVGSYLTICQPFVSFAPKVSPMTYRSRLWAGVAALVILAVVAWWIWPTSNAPSPNQPAKDPLSMTEAQARRMGIVIADERAETSVPIASVTGAVVLPPLFSKFW